MILRNQQQRIRAIRDILQLDQVHVAEALHVTQATVSRWETRGTIHARHMVALEDLLRAHERTHHPPLILRLEAATLARGVLDEHKAGALVSRRLVQLATDTLMICERS